LETGSHPRQKKIVSPMTLVKDTRLILLLVSLHAVLGPSAFFAAEKISPFATDPDQLLERTCFQTGKAWSEKSNLRSDVAIVYGIDAGLPERITTWREHGYRIHVMTGVAWGQYQDYLYGRFDGINHEDEAQMDRKTIPPGYATELQTVMNALNDMKQERVKWDCATTGIGVVASDSLMFQRGEPTPSDPHLGNFTASPCR
jgi:hypothetical protein